MFTERCCQHYTLTICNNLPDSALFAVAELCAVWAERVLYVNNLDMAFFILG